MRLANLAYEETGLVEKSACRAGYSTTINQRAERLSCDTLPLTFGVWRGLFHLGLHFDIRTRFGRIFCARTLHGQPVQERIAKSTSGPLSSCRRYVFDIRHVTVHVLCTVLDMDHAVKHETSVGDRQCSIGEFVAFVIDSLVKYWNFPLGFDLRRATSS